MDDFNHDFNQRSIEIILDEIKDIPSEEKDDLLIFLLTYYNLTGIFFRDFMKTFDIYNHTLGYVVDRDEASTDALNILKNVYDRLRKEFPNDIVNKNGDNNQ